MILEIQAPQAYDLMASIHAWIFPDVQPVPEITDAGKFLRTLTIEEIPVPTVITQKKPSTELIVEWFEERVGKQEIEKKVKWILGFDVKTAPAIKIIKKEPALIGLDAAIRGLRPYLADTPFEALVKSIIQQQVSYRAANVLTKKIVLEAGTKFHTKKGDIYQFPTPAKILSTGDDVFTQIGFGYKARYIKEVSRLVVSQKLDLESLIGQSYEEVHKELIPIRGIGEWTIKALAIAGLGDFSIFPYSDLGIRNLLGKLFGNGERMTIQEVEELAIKWGKTGPLVLYLLMCADVLGLLGEKSRRKAS